MNYYLAPLEGITGYTFRNAVNEFFGDGVNKYFTPFFAPHTKRTMNTKEMRDVHPDNNKGLYLVPQILTNSAADFLRFERDMHELFGYNEVNINLGCPSGTVVPKKRGAGFLVDTMELDEFLAEIFENKIGKVSVKTRLGLDKPEEFYEIFDVYKKYDMEELIIHPRVRNEFYKGRPHWDMFKYALDNTDIPLCFSGDINSVEDFEKLNTYMKDSSHTLSAVMLGRGMVADPSLIRQLSGGQRLNRQELIGYHDRLYEEFKLLFSGQTHLLHKMKELWIYMIKLFPESDKELKRIQKAKNLAEYESIISILMSTFS